MRDVRKPGKLRLAQPSDAFRPIAIDPFYLVDFLAGSLHQIAEKSGFIDDDIHAKRH